MRRWCLIVQIVLVCYILSGQPVRTQGSLKTFTLTGAVAWSTAKTYGFKFYPWVGRNDNCKAVSPDVRDGVRTRLNTKLGWCGNVAIVTLAEVVGGNMIVYNVPFAETHRFVMFERRLLATGWSVKDVQVSNGVWSRQPAYGTADMSFELALTPYNKDASAIVKSIVLAGPSTATDWKDAFKNSTAK